MEVGSDGMIIDNEKKIQEMSGGMDVDSPVKNAQTGAAAATVEETAAGPADADGAREAAPPVNVEEGWRRQGRQRPQIETVEAKVMMYGRFSVQIEGPRDGVTVQAIWSELVRDQSMELMADWKPTWYAPGVQKQCSKFMQLQETPFVKLLAKAGAMQGWLPLFNGRAKCVAAVRRPRDVPSAALRPTEPTPTPPAPAAGNTIPAAAGAARPGVATRKKEHGAAWRDALLPLISIRCVPAVIQPTRDAGLVVGQRGFRLHDQPGCLKLALSHFQFIAVESVSALLGENGHFTAQVGDSLPINACMYRSCSERRHSSQ